MVARLALSRSQKAQLERVIAALAEDVHAPSAVRGEREIFYRHIADSLVALQVPGVQQARQIADIGSGAGFPGLPIAVALPRARVALVESRSVRCRFVARLARQAQIENVSVHCTRVESWEQGLGRCDAVLARALAPQPVVLEYAAPLLALGGVLVDWRGPGSVDTALGERVARMLGLAPRERLYYRTEADGPQRYLEAFVKVAPTPAPFPRRPGMARKRPLGAGTRAEGRAAR